MKKHLIIVAMLLFTIIFSIPAFAAGKPPAAIPAESMAYVILGANDLGMHCMQDDYSAFMVLPPANTVRVQVFKRGDNVPVTTGITLSYSYATHTNNPSTNNTFWANASQYGYGGLAAGQGISGNYTSGTMLVDAANYSYKVEYVPITCYDDNGTFDPYPAMTVTAKDATTGAVLAKADIITPTSSEMSCFGCHGTTNTYQNILQSHDTLQGTTLVADKATGKVHACGECHKDNALGKPGVAGVKPLSEAMHGFHASKIAANSNGITPACYNCHPGPATNCMRGAMAARGKTCTTCHGDMANVASTQAAGREAWLQEPKCGDCHSRYAENTNTLYRNSKLINSPSTKMNGYILCETCHNSTHAEWPSTNAKDNKLPLSLQNSSGPIDGNCKVCHTTTQPSNLVHR